MNRNGFQVDLEREYADVSGLGVLYFDLNNLKETNDKYGHAAGDALLRRIADVLRLICAQLKHAKCYRVGGDEFVLLLTQSTREALKYCAEMFGDCMDNHNQNETLPCSVAVGQAYSEGPCNPEMLVSQADHAMYRCKQMMKDL
ncbi:Diguanylate cyclase DgcN [bioreactor metagenome]|uniref:Diguanylate cyclase DgcN n=1 Tax=bioreactor metagenome TaxID=1076179 RepID=A0A645G2C6_9ZZZZ